MFPIITVFRSQFLSILRIKIVRALNKQCLHFFLFAILLGINVPSESVEVWNSFRGYMIEDFLHSGLDEQDATNAALLEIDEILITHNTNCKELGLPEPTHSFYRELPMVNNENSQAEFEAMYHIATDEQRNVINNVITALECSEHKGNLFYLDAPAGCGKTFVQKALLAKVASVGRISVPVAFTGIAASLVKGGRTLHNQFKLPIPVLDSSVSGVKPDSSHGRYLDSAYLIIIDEASMIPAAALTVMDRMFRDITTKEDKRRLPFAGKVVLFSGDFRQTLPVVPHAGRAVTIENCIKNHNLWRSMTFLQLDRNMRVNQGQEEFANYLLQVGKDTLPKDDYGQSILDVRLLGVGSPIDFIYNDLDNYNNIHEKAILTPTNEICSKINLNVLDRICNEEVTYKSVDTVISDDVNSNMNFPTEFLNSIEVSGLPRHELKLKKGAVIMLMRNLNTAKGLINGTRLQLISLYTNSLDCQVLTGASSGERVILPKIKLSPSDTVLPFRMQRFQFPVTLAFAMTINKSQGQSLKKVAVYLPKPVFSHGQLYVALSRAQAFEGVKIFIEQCKDQRIIGQNQGFTTSNIVYHEIC